MAPTNARPAPPEILPRAAWRNKFVRIDENTLALVWLEQTAPGRFARQTIAKGFPRHATLDVGDGDADGDVDIVTGSFSVEKVTAGWVDLWTNQLRRPAADSGRGH